MAEQEHSLAVLVDFENMARPGLKGRGDFDIHLVLNRLAEKGRVLVKRAYADWSRYREARHELQNAGLSLIEMPSAREGAKNRADIQMAVDAMELAYSREHVNNFVIVSGDSDFTPLVGKLRELNKRVVGVGNRESSSELLIANCDEFIFYDLLSAGAAAAPRSAGGRAADPFDLLRSTLTALQREGVEWPLASVVKDSMRRKSPAFDENEFQFSTFSRFLDEAATRGVVRLETDARSGTYRVELTEGRTSLPAPPSAAAVEERAAEDGARRSDEPEGRRRRRRARRSESGAASEAAGLAAAASAAGADADVEVFEVVVTPTPDVDLAALPPLDEPISYEDMIMLGPEPGDDVPDLTEATDLGADAPPSRSSRRRRRRGVGEAEPTTADLAAAEREGAREAAEVIEAAEGPVEAAPLPEPVLGADGAGASGEAAPASEEPAAPSRRRRRRIAEPAGAGAGEAPPAVEVPAPPAEAAADAGDVEDGAQLPLTVAEPADAGAAAEPEPEAPRRRRVRRGTVVGTSPGDKPQGDPLGAEALGASPPAVPEAAEADLPVPDPAAPEVPVEAEAEAPAEKPRRRRTARKTADEPADGAAAAEAADAPAEPAEEKPKRRRTTRKKAEEPADGAAAADAAVTPAADAPAEPAEEKPKRRRTTRKKAEEPAEAGAAGA